MAKKILLTGVGGFIGAHALEYFLEKTDWEIVGIDSFRHKGSYTRIQSHRHSLIEKYKDRVKIYKHDLTAPLDPQLENLILNKRFVDGNLVSTPIDVIFNFASNSAVERSTSDPVECLRNNQDLMLNMLEFCRRTNPKLLIQISTDEVYGEVLGDAHKEWAVMNPSNPYAASKGAQELMCMAYWRTYDLPIAIVNCMNVIAERQDSEKFLPKIIQKIYRGEEMPIYADSENKIGSRCYLDARNFADALIFVANRNPARYSKGASHLDKYNICGDREMNNLEMAQLVAKTMGKDLKYKLVPSESARPGYDRRYALDGSKLADLGWKAPITFEQTVQRVVAWTLDNQEWLF